MAQPAGLVAAQAGEHPPFQRGDLVPVVVKQFPARGRQGDDQPPAVGLVGRLSKCDLTASSTCLTR